MKRYVKANVSIDLVSQIRREIKDATLQYLKTGRFEDDSIDINDYLLPRELEVFQKYWEKYPDEYDEAINEPQDDSLIEDEVDEDSYAIEVKTTEDNKIFVEVRTELGDGVEYLEDVLNPIIQKYDPMSYFEEETYGIISAYLEI